MFERKQFTSPHIIETYTLMMILVMEIFFLNNVQQGHLYFDSFPASVAVATCLYGNQSCHYCLQSVLVSMVSGLVSSGLVEGFHRKPEQKLFIRERNH